MPSDPVEIRKRLMHAFDRFLVVYAQLGGHNYYGWNDYGDPRNYKGPTFWSEHDCVYRLALELEQGFPHEVHMELPVARWSFSDFEPGIDRLQSVDLVVSELLDFVEDGGSEHRFMRHPHALFVEGKYFPAGCSRRWRADHVRKVAGVHSDAQRLARHLQRTHCVVAAVLVVDDDGLFEDRRAEFDWPKDVELLVASPLELSRRGRGPKT
jgi:hypothetical protein